MSGAFLPCKESCPCRQKRAEKRILARGQHEGANPAGAHTRVCLTSTDIGGLNLPMVTVLTILQHKVVKTATIGNFAQLSSDETVRCCAFRKSLDTSLPKVQIFPKACMLSKVRMPQRSWIFPKPNEIKLLRAPSAHEEPLAHTGHAGPSANLRSSHRPQAR